MSTYKVAGYDVSELSKFKSLEGCHIKRVSLWFQDGEFTYNETVDVGGNITGLDLVDFAIDKILQDASPQNYMIFPKNPDGDELVIDSVEELERMLIKFQVDKVYEV